MSLFLFVFGVYANMGILTLLAGCSSSQALGGQDVFVSMEMASTVLLPSDKGFSSTLRLIWFYSILIKVV